MLTHSLAQSLGPLRWVDVGALGHTSMPLPSTVRQYADAALLHHRVRSEPRFEVERLATINAMVAAGLGVAALPELAAGLVIRRGRSLSMASAAMVDILCEEMQRLAPAPTAGSTIGA